MNQGCDCIDVFLSSSKEGFGIRHNAKTQPVTSDLARDTPVIGSSEQVHVVDALAITGDEGRGSLRKAPGSWQTSFDPEMSEWGNPARMGHPELNT
ncbi:hypothetical protein PSAC2689_420001 [Paraburkholderia sacchari]